jgi:hypothetical protein
MEILIAIILAFALATGAASAVPNQSTEYLGDARLALQIAAERAGKSFVDETAGEGQTLVRFDQRARDLQGLEPLLREIARQLPDDWRIIIRNTEIVLQGPNSGGGA